MSAHFNSIDSLISVLFDLLCQTKKFYFANHFLTFHLLFLNDFDQLPGQVDLISLTVYVIYENET